VSTRRRAAKKGNRKAGGRGSSSRRSALRETKNESSKEAPEPKKVVPRGKAKKSQVEVSIHEPTAQEADAVAVVLQELRGITKKLNRTSSMVCSDEEFRAKVDHLKTLCPPPKRCKVKVSRLPPEEMTSEYGYVIKHRDVFEIYIANNLTDYETTHVLLHEWAHMLAWRPYHPLQGDHGGDWGVWYAVIWRQYHGTK
jgi:hypothetical protein